MIWASLFHGKENIMHVIFLCELSALQQRNKRQMTELREQMESQKQTTNAEKRREEIEDVGDRTVKK